MWNRIKATKQQIESLPDDQQGELIASLLVITDKLFGIETLFEDFESSVNVKFEQALAEETFNLTQTIERTTR